MIIQNVAPAPPIDTAMATPSYIAESNGCRKRGSQCLKVRDFTSMAFYPDRVGIVSIVGKDSIGYRYRYDRFCLPGDHTYPAQH